MIIELRKVLQLLTVLSAYLLFTGCENKSLSVSMIPEPNQIIVNSGIFIFNENTKIIVDSDNPKVYVVAKYFAEQFNNSSGFSVSVVKSAENNNTKNSIIFTENNLNSGLGDEGYSLKSTEDQIILQELHTDFFMACRLCFNYYRKKFSEIK